LGCHHGLTPPFQHTRLGYAKYNIPVNFTAALALNFYEDGLALPVSDTRLSIVFKTDKPEGTTAAATFAATRLS
jgi:hypothetical protein